MNIDNFLLEQGAQVYSIYQTEDLSQSVSLIAKLAFEDSESPFNNKFKVDVSEVRELFPIVSQFKLADEGALIPNSSTRQTTGKCCHCKQEVSILRKELMDFDRRYSKLCMENINLKDKIDQMIRNEKQGDDQIKTMLEQQLIRVLDENKILSLNNQELRKGLDNYRGKEHKNIKEINQTMKQTNIKQLSPNMKGEDMDRVIKYYTNSISELQEQNVELKEQIKQISTILTNQLIKVSKLENKLDEQRYLNQELKQRIMKRQSPSVESAASSSGLGSLSRIRDMIEIKSQIKTPNTRGSPIQQFNLEEMLKISS